MRNVLTHRLARRSAVLVTAVLVLAGALTACSDSDDDTEDTTPDTTATDDTATDDTATDDTATDDTATDDTATDDTATDDTATDDTTTTAVASSEIGTTELLDHLLAEDAAIGALFDWNTGEGIIGVNYLGVQEVGLYAAGDLDEATATTACELASGFVFERDAEAAIIVYDGGYDAAVAVVRRDGEAGSCAAAA